MNKWMLVPAIAATLTIGGVALAKDTPAASKSTQALELLTEDQAITIAKGKVNGVVVEIELDEENNRRLYEIELEDGTYEYDMDIDAVTGKILKFSKEDAENKFDEAPSNLLSRTDAIAIAKKKVNGVVVKFELDDEDDRDVYKIEMKDDHFEYEIVLDAATGEIIEFDKERNRKVAKKAATDLKVDKKQTAEPTLNVVGKPTSEQTLKVVEPNKQAIAAEAKPVKRVKLTKDQAIAIAKGKVSGSVTEIELDGKVYEIEMKNGETEYDIEIDAFTGEVVPFEKD